MWSRVDNTSLYDTRLIIRMDQVIQADKRQSSRKRRTLRSRRGIFFYLNFYIPLCYTAHTNKEKGRI